MSRAALVTALDALIAQTPWSRQRAADLAERLEATVVTCAIGGEVLADDDSLPFVGGGRACTAHVLGVSVHPNQKRS